MKLDFEQAAVSFAAVINSGHARVPDDEPMRDVTALLIDPMSPVNRQAAFL